MPAAPVHPSPDPARSPPDGPRRSGAIAAATSAIWIAGVTALYFGGIIGPSRPDPPRNGDWIELSARLDAARDAVHTALDQSRLGFRSDAGFVAWEAVLRHRMDEWMALAAPRIVLTRAWADDGEARSAQRSIFHTTALALELEAPVSPSGSWRLVAGPFRHVTRRELEAELQRIRIDGDALSFEEFSAVLAEHDIPFTVAREETAIHEARDRALDAYLEEFARHLPQDEPPPIPPVIRLGYGYLSGLSEDPRSADTRAALDQGGFWDRNPEALALAAATAERIRAGGLDETEQDARRGPSVLARAERSFATRPDDLAAARERARRAFGAWQMAMVEAHARATRAQAAWVRHLAEVAASEAGTAAEAP